MTGQNAVERMQLALAEIVTAVDGLDHNAFLADQMQQKAIIYDLTVLGGAAAVMPEAIRQRAPSFPWERLVSLRKHLIEEYYLVDPVEVYAIARNDIPSLREPLDRLRATLVAD